MCAMAQGYPGSDREFDEFEFEDAEFAADHEMSESPFSEAEEFELATELLNISDERELDLFLGKLFKKIGGGFKKVFRPLGRVLKSVAKKALPFLGGALGSFIPIPGVGTAIGSAVGGALSKAFELEFEGAEGIDGEEREFEMARQFVKLAGTAAQQAASAPASANPVASAVAAIKTAGQNIAGSVGAAASVSGMVAGQGGRWIRRGRKIIVLGV